MLPFFNTHFGNAASKSHAFGWYAEEAVQFAREQVGSLIGSRLLLGMEICRAQMRLNWKSK
jgi:cysteine sulfinate desulfinase/cysteine desulfurase-like protein